MRISEEHLEEVADQLLTDQFDLAIKVESFSHLQSALATYINHLITTNFLKLIAILYRLDISERKLRDVLSLHRETDAGAIIANMIIERQLQKIKLRKTFTTKNDQIPEDDRW